MNRRRRPGLRESVRSREETLRTPDGRDRTYHLYVPAGVAGATDGAVPVPLLVALHGGIGSGTQFERTSRFDAIAGREGFIVVYPDGTGAGPRNRMRTWNAGRCCGPAVRQGVDDVTFIRLLIDRLCERHPIDPSRIYAAGHSNGGMLGYRLACELADRIVAVGVQSSGLEAEPRRPARPVSLLHIHGSADQNVPIAGGAGPRAISKVAYRVPIEGAKTVAAFDGCPPDPSLSTEPGNPDVTIRTWGPGTDGVEVVFMTVAGGSHAWMGAPAVTRFGASPYARLDSSAVIWRFLAAHPRA